jgi:hypothetical protein
MNKLDFSHINSDILWRLYKVFQNREPQGKVLTQLSKNLKISEEAILEYGQWKKQWLQEQTTESQVPNQNGRILNGITPASAALQTEVACHKINKYSQTNDIYFKTRFWDFWGDQRVPSQDIEQIANKALPQDPFRGLLTSNIESFHSQHS